MEMEKRTKLRCSFQVLGSILDMEVTICMVRPWVMMVGSTGRLEIRASAFAVVRGRCFTTLIMAECFDANQTAQTLRCLLMG